MVDFLVLVERYLDNMSNYTQYLGIKHDYLNINCITLIERIYKEQLGSDVFSDLWKHLEIKNGKPKEGTRWKFKITFDKILEWTNKNARKVDLRDLKEYDVFIFKSKKNRPLHFGMYIGENKFIHIEEESTSVISLLNQDWRDQIHSIYRRGE